MTGFLPDTFPFERCNVYGIYDPAAKTHDLVIPANNRYLIFFLDSQTAYTAIYNLICMSTGAMTVIHMTGGTGINFNTSTPYHLKVSYSDSSSKNIMAIVMTLNTTSPNIVPA